MWVYVYLVNLVCEFPRFLVVDFVSVKLGPEGLEVGLLLQQ